MSLTPTEYLRINIQTRKERSENVTGITGVGIEHQVALALMSLVEERHVLEGVGLCKDARVLKK